jgi:6-phosphofructokinase 1
LQDDYVKGKAHCMVVVAEGYKPGTRALAQYLQEHRERLGFGVRVTVLGHVQRGGAPAAFDRLLATRMGATAVTALQEGNYGQMVSLMGDRLVPIPLAEALAQPRTLNLDLYNLSRQMEI